MGSDTPVSGRGKWLALAAALLGWMFDGLEMGLFPLVGRPALRELFGPGVDEGTVGQWYGVITAGFLVGAATGGVLFGWLGDKLGRIRALTLSVLVYAGCSGACAFVVAPWQLAGLRFAGALGMGGEWALGVALVMELWPNASRAWLAGWIGAFGNLGYFVVGLVALALNRVGGDLPVWLASAGLSDDWVARLTANNNWRLLMLFGAMPAVLTLFIRLFVPESERWLREKEAGAASHWSGRDLLAVLGGAVAASAVIAVWAVNQPWAIRTLSDSLGLTADGAVAAFWAVRLAITVIGLVCVTLGYLYPARQYLTRATSESERRHVLGRMLLGAGLSAVALLATWGGFMWIYPWVQKLSTDPDAAPVTQVSSSLGAAFGCVVGALLGGRYGRRPVYAGLCVLSLVTLLGMFNLNDRYGWQFVLWAGVTGAVTASFYGWLPLYLPELFPTKVRATGQGFGFNFGRILAAVGALQTGNLLALFDNDYSKACSIAAGVYVVGLLLIALAPETKGKPLPE